MKKITRILPMILIIVALAYSCKDDNTSPAIINTNDTTYADIKWSDNTVKFEETDIQSADSLYENISFKSSAASAKTLKVGDFIFVYGKALRKVSSIVNIGGITSVTTEDCNLNEAIKDGEIGWYKSLIFTPDMVKKVKFFSKTPGIQEENGKEVKFTFPVGEDMTGEIKLTLNNERLDATCEITKEIGPAKIKYSMEGFVQKMKSEGKLKFEDHSLKEFKYVNNNIEGEVTVALTATGSSNDLMPNGFELPFTIIQVPVVIAGIPCLFNLKFLFVINTEMASLDASAHISTKFSFNSQAGVKYEGTDVGVVGSAGPYNMDFLKDSCWVASSTVAGINFGLTFPRFELAIFGKVLVPYVQTAFLIGGTFTAGTKPCLKIDASFIGGCGYNFNFLGLLKTSGKKNLWQWDRNIKKIGECD